MPENQPDDRGRKAEGGPIPAGDAAPNLLTPEEQMALYEQDLKEKDWGHQPC
jgi:hypothetical protein